MYYQCIIKITIYQTTFEDAVCQPYTGNYLIKYYLEETADIKHT